VNTFFVTGGGGGGGALISFLPDVYFCITKMQLA